MNNGSWALAGPDRKVERSGFVHVWSASLVVWWFGAWWFGG